MDGFLLNRQREAGAHCVTVTQRYVMQCLHIRPFRRRFLGYGLLIALEGPMRFGTGWRCQDIRETPNSRGFSVYGELERELMSLANARDSHAVREILHSESRS